MPFCGIDPGRDKFGLAVADGVCGERLLFSAVIPTGEIDLASECVRDGRLGGLSRWRAEGDAGDQAFHLDCIYIGSGTCLNFFSRKLDEKNIIYNIIDECFTTLDGRKLYWKLHPPVGLWRLVPISMRVPPRPVDDLAAWAIMRRGMGGGENC